MAIFGFGKKKDKGSGNFMDFDSMKKIQQAVDKGLLAPMYLISPIFGGAEDISNILYVPSEVIKFKDSIDDILADALKNGKKVQGFSMNAEYKGDSIVPSKIKIKAGGDVNIEETIDIW